MLTLQVAALATVLVLVPGTALAFALARRGWRGRSVIEALVNLPLVLPPTATGLALLLLFSRRGPLGSFLHGTLGIDIAFTFWAAVLAAAVVGLPLYVRSVRGALEELDPRLVGMARSLGHTRRSALLHVELPLAWRGLVAGSLITFTRALGEFGATVLFAGNIPGRTQTIALALFQRVQVGRDREALMLAGVAALVAFVVLLIAERFERRRLEGLDDGAIVFSNPVGERR